MYHVYSTMANNNEYVRYSTSGPGGINLVERTVLIKGGSGINLKGFGTQLGVYNSVSDEDMEWLKNDYSFQQHMAKGYITMQKHKSDPEVVAADMVTRDQKTDACPIVPQDFKSDGGPDNVKPVVSKSKKVA